MKNQLVQITSGTANTITDANLFGGISYECSINPNTDLDVGTAASAKIEFITDKLTSSSIGQKYTYYIKQKNDGSTWRQIGIFNIVEATKNSNGKYKIVAYDNVYKFETDVTSYINSFNGSTTLANFFSGLCSYSDIGCSAYSTSFINNSLSFSPSSSIGGNYINGRTVLGYIASVAGGFAKARPDGTIEIAYFSSSTDATLNNTQYKSLITADYTAPVIDCVKVAMSDSDAGITYPTSGSQSEGLRIQYNPIFYNGTTSVMSTYVANIYNKVHTYSYTPMSIELLEDFGINVGNRIYVNNTYYGYIFSKKFSSSGVTLECSGNATRAVEIDASNSEIQSLVGKYHTIENNVEKHKQVLGDLLTGDECTFEITANGVSISNAGGSVTTFDGSQITANTINASDINLTGRIAFGDCDSNLQTKIESGNVPAYIKSTYIDEANVISPRISGSNVEVWNGQFKLMDQSGSTEYAYMGLGSYADAEGSTVTPGAVLQSVPQESTSRQAYLIINTNGARLQYGNYAIILKSTGAYVNDNGTLIRMGEARFS